MLMPISKEEILGLAEKLYPVQVKWRRRFHQYPELSNQEFQTTRFIKSEMARHKIRILPLKMKTGTVGLLNSRMKRAIAIRTDLDALSIQEATSLAFKSRNQGIMHACGHDIHMAVVLGTAILLNKLKDSIPAAVKFIFQPSEEMPPGGAADMIKAGVLKSPPVEMIFGLHTDPSVPTGKIGLRDGPIMASVTDFDITVIGKGGHAARPHIAVDAVVVAAEVVDAMQKIVSREINPLKPIVITFGSIEGGTARNVIAEKTVLRGTARTLSPDSLQRIPALIRRTVDGICRARGAKYELDFIAQYPVLSNHKMANLIFADACRDIFGKNRIIESPQSMGGEDFAFYLEKVPGAMFRLGVKNNRIGANRPWHASDFIADERSIFFGTALLSWSVLKYFERSL
jgi:amidohydrolase